MNIFRALETNNEDIIKNAFSNIEKKTRYEKKVEKAMEDDYLKRTKTKSSFNPEEYKKKYYEYLNDNRRPLNMNSEIMDMGIYSSDHINETNYKKFDKFYKKYKDVVEKNEKKYNDLINDKNNPPKFIKSLKIGTNDGKDFSFLDSFLNTKILYMGKGKKYTLDDDDKERIAELNKDLDKYKKEMKTFKEKKTYKSKKIPPLKWAQIENTIEAYIENIEKKIIDIKYNVKRKENRDNIERAYKNKHITKDEYDELIGNVSYNTQDDLATTMSKKGYYIIYEDNPNEKAKPNKPITSRDSQIAKKGYSNVLKARSDMIYEDDKPKIKTDLKLRKGLKDKEKKAIKLDVIEKLNKQIEGGRFISQEAYNLFKGDKRGLGISINLDSDDEIEGTGGKSSKVYTEFDPSNFVKTPRGRNKEEREHHIKNNTYISKERSNEIEWMLNNGYEDRVLSMAERENREGNPGLYNYLVFR